MTPTMVTVKIIMTMTPDSCEDNNSCKDNCEDNTCNGDSEDNGDDNGSCNYDVM